MQNSKAANEKEEIRKRQFEALMKSDNEGQKDEDEGVVGQDDLIKLIQRTAAPKNEKPSFPVNHQEEEVESSDSSTSAVEEGGSPLSVSEDDGEDDKPLDLSDSTSTSADTTKTPVSEAKIEEIEKEDDDEERKQSLRRPAITPPI